METCFQFLPPWELGTELQLLGLGEAGAGMNGSGGVGAARSLVQDLAAPLHSEAGVCFATASGSIFAFSCPKGPGVFLLGWLCLPASEWQRRARVGRDGGAPARVGLFPLLLLILLTLSFECPAAD